jgi:hypothetical protein
MDAKGLARGLYRVYWKSGGVSIAAVGVTMDGYHWLAPCNWACINSQVADYCKESWELVERVELIEGIDG